jgi:hypothetical protein
VPKSLAKRSPRDSGPISRDRGTPLEDSLLVIGVVQFRASARWRSRVSLGHMEEKEEEEEEEEEGEESLRKTSPPALWQGMRAGNDRYL